ncbi:hypothetical protein FPZ43_07225 [Mucilaginibacter pallidiroseus]|uniref:DUF6377 domain-containing protein n=1 Tax=Mucilaginibacter pallidiroseus TaxID=2599295 RepID=A0A563UE74_9SPHI|nr:hypothetical protein FPZ43_07225 [Mucilaginibacter pallidiroseus]
MEYKDYLFDSAHIYTTKLIDISNRIPDMAKQYDSRIKLATIQLSWGMFKETFDGIYQMDSKKMPDSLKIKYYELKSIAYGRLALYNTDENYNADHKAASLKALDSVVLLSKPGSYERHFYAAAYYKRLGHDAKAEAHYRALLNMDKLTQHQKAMVAHDLSHITDDNEKRNLITVSAIADIRSSTKETLAIFTLGKMLFEQGNLTDAEILIKEALSQASFYGNKLRVMEASTALNAVLAEKLIRLESGKNKLLTFLIIVLVLAICGTLIIAKKVYDRLKVVRLREAKVLEQNQHLDQMNKKLAEDAIIKEEYIGYFFSSISANISQREKLKRSMERIIKTESLKDLQNLVKSIDVKQERATLFNTFDHIFLKLFPNFITSFNKLLPEVDHVIPKKTEVLNTSLRIFALMRLGIKENQTIANILENTVSTIYTYKFRIKSKALVKGDEFDKMIMQIKFSNPDDYKYANDGSQATEEQYIQ